jgi:phospholipase A-2-activating protein
MLLFIAILTLTCVSSVAALPSGGFVSCGEDHSVRVWGADGDNAQVIPIPAQSVWCVAVLPSGDVVAGSRYIIYLKRV